MSPKLKASLSKTKEVKVEDTPTVEKVEPTETTSPSQTLYIKNLHERIKKPGNFCH